MNSGYPKHYCTLCWQPTTLLAPIATVRDDKWYLQIRSMHFYIRQHICVYCYYIVYFMRRPAIHQHRISRTSDNRCICPRVVQSILNIHENSVAAGWFMQLSPGNWYNQLIQFCRAAQTTFTARLYSVWTYRQTLRESHYHLNRISIQIPNIP